MLDIQHKGLVGNFPLDQSTLSGVATADVNTPYIQSLLGGKVVSVSPTGLKLADGSLDSVLGFLVLDAAGYPYENVPSLASGVAAVTLGNQVVLTDQVVAGLTILAGEPLYAATGANAGLLTNVAPVLAAGAPVGAVSVANVVGIAVADFGGLATAVSLQVFVK